VKSPDEQDPVPLGLSKEIAAGQLMKAETDDCIAVVAATGPTAPVEAAAIIKATTRLDARGDMDFKLAEIYAQAPLKTVSVYKSVFVRAYAGFIKIRKGSGRLSGEFPD